jgi:hypothetical protein
MPVPKYQSVTLQNEASSRAGHSRRAMPIRSPPSRASKSKVGPVTHRQSERKVSTGTSARTNFIAGQFMPQTSDKPASRSRVDDG